VTIGFYGGKFLPLHMGHVNCIITASTMCDKLYVGLSHSENRDKQLCNDKMPYISVEKRLQWLDQLTSSFTNIEIFEFMDEDGIEYNSWEDGANQVRRFIGENIDYVFGSEGGYKEIFNKIYPSAQYILIDSAREKFKISATQLREDGVFAHWDAIPNVCKPYFNKKVMVVGTESCGKSTLVNKLALYYNTEYVEEYGRLMCEELNTGQPTKEYYPYIAYGHKMHEFQKNKRANKLLFIDTESVVTQFYSELYANTHYDVLDEMAKLHKYDLWLFLEPDVEWVNDGLRKHGLYKERAENNSKLKEMLRLKNIKIIVINGNYNERFDKSIKEIDKLLQ